VIVGLGIDVIEVARLAEALRRHGDHFEERVFTDAERESCRARGDRVLALAARFAAKEACLKALGTGWAEGVGFRDVEVVREGNRPPQLVLHGEAARRAEARGVVRSHVSLTHQPGLAAAVVVLEST
jgi:holo-[acyl-carrier protein] synthase